jgi:hopene-associated glycosyltransferase HpnB
MAADDAVWLAVAASALAAWLYLAVGHGLFWRTSITLPTMPGHLERWPSVVAVVPARNEAAMLPETLPTLLAQDYPGAFRVVVVDDDSDDGTGELARSLGADVVESGGPPPGWVGKVSAMAVGVSSSGESEFVLFTDADIAYPSDALRKLVAAAAAGGLDMVSQMARLRTRSRWERVIVPAFVYFFGQLYPFARVNSRRSRVAAAAGGCMLVRRATLEDAGGLAAIADALIDDVALGRLLKHRGGGRIWLGLSSTIRSVRPYPSLADLWNMVARSAYTQLRYSPLLLAATVCGMLLVYVAPPVATIAGALTAQPGVVVCGAAAWAVMTATYVPMLRFYRVSPLSAPALPLVASLYLAMTLDSAWQHLRGRGGAWKGRTSSGATSKVKDARTQLPSPDHVT